MFQEILTVVLIAFGLSMDTFAVSLTAGTGMCKYKFNICLKLAICLAFCQAALTFLGWLCGESLLKYIAPIDHWLAFGVLAFIGIKTILDAIKNEEGKATSFKFTAMMLAGIMTSIDAFAVGLTFACIELNIAAVSAIIFIITFCVSIIGTALGAYTVKFNPKLVKIIGGIVLICLGIDILLEHLLA